MNVSTITPAALRLPEAAQYVGVSTGTIKKLARTGQLRSVKLNRARVFPRQALDDLLAGKSAQ